MFRIRQNKYRGKQKIRKIFIDLKVLVVYKLTRFTVTIIQKHLIYKTGENPCLI